MSAAKLTKWDATNATTSPQAREGVRVIDAFRKITSAPPILNVSAYRMSVLSQDHWNVA